MSRFYTDTGSFSQAEILGNLLVSGTLTVSGSVLLNGGNLSGTSSWASNVVSASYALNTSNATTASYILNAVSASYSLNANTASYATNALNANTSSLALRASGSLTGSLLGTATTASYVLNAVSASYATNTTTATTASYVLNAVSASYATNALSVATSSLSLRTSGSMTGSLQGTASYATVAQTLLGSVVSASYALTASYAANGGGGSAFPYNGNAVITGSLTVSGSTNTVKIQGSGSNIFVVSGSQGEMFTISEDSSDINLYRLTSASIDIFVVKDPKVVAISGSLIVTGSIIGSLQGTAATASYFSGSISNATSASYALTASYAVNGGGGGGSFPYSGSALITGSLTISGSGANSPIVKVQGSGSSIFVVSGSTGALLQIGDISGSNEVFAISSGSIDILTINSSKVVAISGSLVVTGSITGSLLGTASYALSGGSGGSGSPGGADTTIQFNDGGSFSGSGDFTFNKTASQVKLNGFITASILTGALRLGEITVTPSSNQNDYNPTGWNNGGASMATTLRISASADIKITGLAGGLDNRIAIIENGSTDYLIILEDQSTSSTAANRFDFRNPVFLVPGGNVTLVYDEYTQYWRALASSGGIGWGAFFNQQEEFMGSIGVWGSAVSGTGASVQISTYLQNTTEKPMGMWQADTGTTATGRAHIGAIQAASIFPGSGSAICLTRLAVEALPTPATEAYQVWAGWHDAVGATTITDGVYWQFDSGSSAAWQGSSARAATRTTTGAAGPTVDLNYIWLGIWVNALWTKACYFYSTDSVTWIIAGTQSLNMPSSSANSTGFGVTINKTVGTTQRNISVDYLAHRYDVSRG